MIGFARYASAILGLCVAGTSGCESSVFQYDCRGRLLKSDGTPAAGVQVHIDDSGAANPAGWDDSVLETAVTNSSGRFRAFCVGALYTRWLGIDPPDPLLREAYVWYRDRDGWRAIRVPLIAEMQKFSNRCGTEVELPDATMPQLDAPSTREASPPVSHAIGSE